MPMPSHPHDLDPDFDGHGLTCEPFQFTLRGETYTCRLIGMSERSAWREWLNDDVEFFRRTLDEESFERFMTQADHPIAPLSAALVGKIANVVVNAAILGIDPDPEDGVTEPPKRRGSSRGRNTAAAKSTGA